MEQEMQAKIDMLKKVKLRIGLSDSEQEQDPLLLLMIEDAMKTITLFCNRSVFPWQLEHIARSMVFNAFMRENGENVSSIKRGDTQITYTNAITSDDMTMEQKDLCCKCRRLRTR